MRNHIEVGDSPVPSGSYAQARIAAGLLFLAGVGPYDPISRAIVGKSVEEQTRQVLENIGAVLRGAGAGFSDIVSTTVYLAQLERDWSAFDRVYGSYFEPPFPARTAVGATLKNVLVEISAVAELPGESDGVAKGR